MNTYAITGASGSLGTALTHHLLSQGHKVRALARNEHRLAALRDSVPTELRDNLSIMCGDVRSLSRLKDAFIRADYVIHAAAMKSVPQCEYDPVEAKLTNIDGTVNVATAARECGVKRAVFISSDKACSPHNLYGMTKACGERLWLNSNRYSAGQGTEFVAVRYGNVFGSNGSVILKWFKAIGEIIITDPECTRFHFKLVDAVQFVIRALHSGTTGSLYVPVLPSYSLRDLAEAFQRQDESRPQKRNIIGLQPGEKLHECMVNEHEASHAIREGDQIRIDPMMKLPDGCPVLKSYTSGANSWRLSVEELKGEIAGL